MKFSHEVKELAGGILIGSACGAAGVAAGFFLAPMSGKKLRSAMWRNASRVWDRIGSHF